MILAGGGVRISKAEKQLTDADKWLILSNPKLEALLSNNPDPDTRVETLYTALHPEWLCEEEL